MRDRISFNPVGLHGVKHMQAYQSFIPLWPAKKSVEASFKPLKRVEGMKLYCSFRHKRRVPISVSIKVGFVRLFIKTAMEHH